MITQEQQKQGAELIKTLAQKAWESSTFKEQLISNPVSTIESVTGQMMIENVKIVVEDQTDDSIIYLNIPRNIDIDGIELTEEQLEMVSGGTVYIPILWAAGAVVTCVSWGYKVGVDLANTHNAQAAAAAAPAKQ